MNSGTGKHTCRHLELLPWHGLLPPKHSPPSTTCKSGCWPAPPPCSSRRYRRRRLNTQAHASHANVLSAQQVPSAAGSTTAADWEATTAGAAAAAAAAMPLLLLPLQQGGRSSPPQPLGRPPAAGTVKGEVRSSRADPASIYRRCREGLPCRSTEQVLLQVAAFRAAAASCTPTATASGWPARCGSITNSSTCRRAGRLHFNKLSTWRGRAGQKQ